MKYTYLLLAGLLLSSCATKEEVRIVKKKVAAPLKESVADLLTIPQDPRVYTKNILSTSLSSQSAYEAQYFRVWNIKKSNISLSDATWAHRAYKVGSTYGENLQLLEQSFYDDVLKNANYEEYLTLNTKALTLKRLNIRAMPSSKPILLDPAKAGEGFPFDYLQNSSIAANKPIIISHYSKDKQWAFVESSFAYGWVKSNSIVTLDAKYTKLWQQAEQIFITKEGVPIYSDDGEFLFKSRIGMMLALISENDATYTILTVAKYKNKKPLYIRSTIDKSIAHKNMLEFNGKNINKILKEISKTNYGWGGIYAQRDCSSTLRDFYAPFGLWLPRNSYKQSLFGDVISLEGLSREEKLNIIKEKALPFRTLLYKKGHIALYVGMQNKKPIIYQNIWGVKTQKDGVEGRYIIGKPIFSTLEVGKNLREFEPSSSLLNNLKSITIL